MKRRPSVLVVLVVAGVIGLVGLLAYGVASQDPKRSLDEAVARGERATPPAVELPPLGGGAERSLDDYRGKVVVLNYWASWCEPCREESPLLERWHRRISQRGGTVLGIDVLDVTSDAQRFIAKYGLTYPQLRDNDGATQGDFGIAAYPETFVLDRDGKVAAIRRGPVDEEFLSSTLPPLLREN